MIPGNEKWAARPVVLIPDMPEMDRFVQLEAWATVVRYLAGDIELPECAEWLDHCRQTVEEAQAHIASRIEDRARDIVEAEFDAE